MTIKPIGNNIVIKQNINEEKHYGNIVVPDMGKEKALIGEIVAVGPGIYTVTGEFIPTELKIGQSVVFPSFGGQRIDVMGEEYLVYKETDLLVVIED